MIHTTHATHKWKIEPSSYRNNHLLWYDCGNKTNLEVLGTGDPLYLWGYSGHTFPTKNDKIIIGEDYEMAT